MREKLVARYGTAEMLCFSIRRTMMVDVGFFDAVYVHDKRRTGEEKGEQKQAPFLLWRFLAFFGKRCDDTAAGCFI
jgi:hypothetical protein